jgi:hypothetical protein
MKIEKSQGVTQTERVLADLCDKTFLKLWSFANPFKADEKELCDLIAIFENHVFIFFDRESRKFDNTDKDIMLSWRRWKKKVIDKQIKTSNGAEKYIKSSSKIYLDTKCTRTFPINISASNIIIHKIIVAHGADHACKNFAPNNISGSLAISYGIPRNGTSFPFMVNLDKNNPVHVLDSHNLEIILGELDTFFDFISYIEAKEEAIQKLDCLCYCGEEDLLAHYFMNYNESKNKHYIGTKDKKINGVFIGEGEWKDFSQSEIYNRRKLADKESYLWDNLLQYTCQNALDGTLMGNADIFNVQSAIYEMAKEPRFSRRALSEHMLKSIRNFPENMGHIVRNISFIPSFYKEKGYVFLQLKDDNILDYDNDYRPIRQKMLKIACGVTKNKFTRLKKIIGIAIDAPKFSKKNSEDFILLNCENWTKEDKIYYEKANKGLNFYETDSLQMQKKTVSEFPILDTKDKPKKIGRNEKCPCGSGKKYKKCCGK